MPPVAIVPHRDRNLTDLHIPEHVDPPMASAFANSMQIYFPKLFDPLRGRVSVIALVSIYI